MPISKPRHPADHPKSTDRFILAGEEAEKQMAFYLDRAFGKEDDIALFHDLRLVYRSSDGGDLAAQIDHLVVHPFGFVIVESKSVTGKLRVNAQGEFIRVYNGIEKGMASPVTQARNQMDALVELLGTHAGELLGTLLGKQKQFGGATRHVFAAISDQGIIERECPVPELVKADAVADEIRKLIAHHRAHSGVGGLLKWKSDDYYIPFSKEEFERICAFLATQHTPLRAPAPAQAKAPAPAPAARQAAPAAPTPAKQPPPAPKPANPAPACSHCQSPKIDLVYRKNYCFQCLDCQKYTRIDTTCPACRKPAKLRKDGPAFHWNCPPPEGCGHQALYWRSAGNA